MDQNRNAGAPENGEGAQGNGHGERAGGAKRAGARAMGAAARERRESGVVRDLPERSTDATVDVRATAEEGLMAVGRALEEQLRERPYVTLAAAVGAGFVLAQALSSRVGRIALLAAGGYAATHFLRSDGLRVLEGMLGGDVDDEDIDDEREATEPSRG